MAKGTMIEVVKNDFPKIAGHMDDNARDLVRETMLYIEGAAKSAAPVRTGVLAGGIQTQGPERTATGWVGYVLDPVEYAAYVNYGTGSRGQSSDVPDRPPEIAYTGSWLGMTARPFMSQAAHDGREKFESAAKKIIQT